jgi:uncharacterized protein YdhG (YjbR/CyaY superfamily)
MNEQTYANIAEYIAQFDGEVKAILEKTYQTIHLAAPDASEKISYRMPCFWDGGPLVYFAGMKNHLGFYPTADGMDAFKERLTDYKTSKGVVQFPYNKPIPYDLIAEIAKFRVNAALLAKGGAGDE